MYPVSHIFRIMRIYRTVHIYLVLNELFKRALGDRCTFAVPDLSAAIMDIPTAHFCNGNSLTRTYCQSVFVVTVPTSRLSKVTVPYNSYRQLPAPPISPLQWFSVSPRGYAQDNNERWTDNSDNTDFLAPVEIIRSRNHNHTVIL